MGETGVCVWCACVRTSVCVCMGVCMHACMSVRFIVPDRMVWREQIFDIYLLVGMKKTRKLLLVPMTTHRIWTFQVSTCMHRREKFSDYRACTT